MYYIEAEERKKQVERLASWLKPGGKLVLIHGANIQSESHDKARMMRELGSVDTDVESERIIGYLRERGHRVESDLLESSVIATLENMIDSLKFLLHKPLPELEPRTDEIRQYVAMNLWDEELQKYRLRIPQDVVIVTADSAGEETANFRIDAQMAASQI